MSTKSEVFLSYAPDTKVQAEKLTEALRHRGVHIWAAFKDLQPGQKLEEETEKALDKADSCLVMIGAKNQVGSWQQWEWRTVLEKVWTDFTKKLVPLIIGKNEVPIWLRSWEPVTIDPRSDTASWSSAVLKAIQNGHRSGARILTSHDKEARQLRFSEIASAAHDLKRFETTESVPTVDPGA